MEQNWNFFFYLWVVLLLCFSLLCKPGESKEIGLSLNGVQCGQLHCKRGDYCNNFDTTCQPCKNICDLDHHNYDATLCTASCQDYIHDLLYVKREAGSNEDLRRVVSSLSRLVTVTLTLVVFMLVVLAGVLCFQLYRWKKKKNITLSTIRTKFLSKKSSSNGDKPPQTAVHLDTKPDLRLEIQTNGSDASPSPVTMTTSISRRAPAEDSALDYAYDNPAMTGSPNTTNTSNTKSHEHKF